MAVSLLTKPTAPDALRETTPARSHNFMRLAQTAGGALIQEANGAYMLVNDYDAALAIERAVYRLELDGYLAELKRVGDVSDKQEIAYQALRATHAQELAARDAEIARIKDEGENIAIELIGEKHELAGQLATAQAEVERLKEVERAEMDHRISLNRLFNEADIMGMDLIEQTETVLKQLTAAEARAKDAERDRERLDWLFSELDDDRIWEKLEATGICHMLRTNGCHDFRTAIDAARATEGKK